MKHIPMTVIAWIAWMLAMALGAGALYAFGALMDLLDWWCGSCGRGSHLLTDLLQLLALGYFLVLAYGLGLAVGQDRPRDRRDAAQIRRDEREMRERLREREQRDEREYIQREAEYEREQQREREYERELRERGYIESYGP